MKILLIGATGYIGSAVADILRASGHEVSGLARSDASAALLKSRGFRIVSGDLREPEGIAAASRTFDGVIHVALDRGPGVGEAELKAVESVLNAIRGSGKSFIYTSSAWVLGNTGSRLADEDSSIDPLPFVSWRLGIERLVLDAAGEGVRTAVIRPAIVYGRGGGLLEEFALSALRTSVVAYVGSGENYWTLVHVEDLADLYLRALERAPAGSLLLAASSPPVRVSEIAEAVSWAMGFDGTTVAWPADEARKVIGDYADVLALDQQISGKRATRLLGWKPQALPLLGELVHGSYAANCAPAVAALENVVC
jgi:nucleoside-diphosphate-sugar epimerase